MSLTSGNTNIIQVIGPAKEPEAPERPCRHAHAEDASIAGGRGTAHFFTEPRAIIAFLLALRDCGPVSGRSPARHAAALPVGYVPMVTAAVPLGGLLSGAPMPPSSPSSELGSTAVAASWHPFLDSAGLHVNPFADAPLPSMAGGDGLACMGARSPSDVDTWVPRMHSSNLCFNSAGQLALPLRACDDAMLAWLPHGAVDSGLLSSSLPPFVDDGFCRASISSHHHHDRVDAPPRAAQKLHASLRPGPYSSSGAACTTDSPSPTRLVELSLLAMRGVASAYRDLLCFRHAK